MDENKIKEFIFQAYQAGKSETSGLVKDILDKVDAGIGVAVKKHINGDLVAIKNHLTAQDTKLEKMDHKIDDFKIKILPLIQGLTVIKLLKKFIVWAAPLGLIFSWLKWLR